MHPRSGRGPVAGRPPTESAESAESPVPAPVAVRVLGPLEVEVLGRRQSIPGRRERAVLTLLAVHVGEPVSVARLGQLLWADDPPRTADKSLQTYVSRLRRVLGDETSVLRREAAYVLTLPRDAVDAARFRDEVATARAAERTGDRDAARRGLRRALGWWRGDEPADAGDTPEGTALRDHLVEARLAALTACLSLELRAGRPEAVATEVEEVLVRYPLREELWSLLVEALARSGRPGAALGAYDRAREGLAEQLGLDPSPALQDLQRRILAADPELTSAQAVGVDRDPARTAASALGHLRRLPAPTDASALVGRGRDRERVRAALAAGRLVTLVGTGGVGKTRLALDVAGDWPETGVLCELAAAAGPAAVPHALAAAVGIEPEPGRDPLDALAHRLAEDPVLLVVDNCEHVLTEVRGVVHVLLGRCPRLRVLATSRQPLGVTGEFVVTLAPLSVGAPDADADRLFLDRAARTGVVLPDDERRRALVRQICTALDGLPLAIELAAALARVLSLDDIEQHLDDRLGLLAEPRLLGGRERSLPDAVAWSYDLLTPEAQTVLRRAGAFAGGFGVDAARQVCGGDGVGAREVPRLLVALAERSLLERVDDGDDPGDHRNEHRDGGGTRYRMLQTLREFARSVQSEEEAERTQRAHAHWTLERAQELAGRLLSADEAAVVAQLEQHLDDARVAVRWALDEEDLDVGFGLLAALQFFAFLGLRSEVFAWVDEAVRRYGDRQHPLVTEVLGAAAGWRSLSGDAPGAEALGRRIVAAEEAGWPLGPVAAETLAGLAARQGDFAAADRYLTLLAGLDGAALSAVQAAGDVAVMAFAMGDTADARRRIETVIAEISVAEAPSVRAFADLGTAVILLADDPNAALPHIARARSLARSVGSRLVERVALSAGVAVAVRVDDPAAALAAFRDTLAEWQRHGIWRMEWGTVQSLMELLARLERHEELLVLQAAGAASATAPPLYGEQAVRVAQAVERAEKALGAERAASARERGRALSDVQAVTYARTLVAAPPPAG